MKHATKESNSAARRQHEQGEQPQASAHPMARVRRLLAAAAHLRISHLQARVLLAIASHADEQGRCFPGAEAIAALCGYGDKRPKELYEAIYALEKHGFLRIQRAVSRKNRRAIIGYRILIPSGPIPDRRRGLSPTAVGGHPCHKGQGEDRPSGSHGRDREETARATRASASPHAGVRENSKEAQAWKSAGLRHLEGLRSHEPRDLADALLRLQGLKPDLARDRRRFGAYLSRVVKEGSIPALAEEQRALDAEHARRSRAAMQAQGTRRREPELEEPMKREPARKPAKKPARKPKAAPVRVRLDEEGDALPKVGDRRTDESGTKQVWDGDEWTNVVLDPYGGD